MVRKMANQLRGQLMSGDLAWARIAKGLWWPAQVVDEKCVTEKSKPARRSANEVLVRLYGSYTYLYVDPAKYRSEFESILKKNNGSYRDVFLNSLEQDIHLKAGILKRGSVPESGEGSEGSSRKETTDGESGKKQELDSPIPVPFADPD